MISIKEIKSNLQPVDVTKVLNISREVFIRLPQRVKIDLLSKVYSGEFKNINNEEEY